MNVIDAIQKRRSVREYLDKKPDWRTILEALNSARFAPMTGGMFSMYFMLIDDKEKIEEISKWAEQPFITKANYLVAVISDPTFTQSYKDKSEKFLHQQAGAAIQNFMLHLTEAGLSTCWVGYFNDEKVRKILKIDEGYEIEAIFPIGYPKKPMKRKRAKGDFYNLLTFNDWKTTRMRRKEDIESRSPFGYGKEKTKD